MTGGLDHQGRQRQSGSEIRPAFGGHVDIGRRYRSRDEAKQLLKTITEGVEGVEKSIDGFRDKADALEAAGLRE